MDSPISENYNGLEEAKSKDIEAELSFGRARRLAPLPDAPVKTNKLGFEYAEHGFLGDTITLKLDNGRSMRAYEYPFTLQNGLFISYGQINGLAGDFYGTTDPISDGADLQAQCARFSAAWATLAVDRTRQPGEAQAILSVLNDEVQQVNKAFNDHVDPSTVYANLPDETLTFQKMTLLRPSKQPSYLGLAKINWDHFGQDARTAYNAGHTVALREAIQGRDLQTLLNAYSMNAFADHFLEDSFSAGHLRTPRRQLHSFSGDADLCSKFMHDEDNAIGLAAVNPNGDSWTMYGDKRLLDQVDDANRQLCFQAVQASADEIFQAWSTQEVPQPENFQAWNFAPTLASVRATTQVLAPLFTFEQIPKRRVSITDRRQWNFTLDYYYAKTALDCKTSGFWKYPITLYG